MGFKLALVQWLKGKQQVNLDFVLQDTQQPTPSWGPRLIEGGASSAPYLSTKPNVGGTPFYQLTPDGVSKAQ